MTGLGPSRFAGPSDIAPPVPSTVIVPVGLVAVVLYVAALVRLMSTTTYDIWGAMVVGPVLAGVTLLIVTRLERNDGRLVGLLMAALVLRMIAAVVRHQVAFITYEGQADAGRYAAQGAAFARAVWEGTAPTVDIAGGEGTHFIATLTGVIFTGIGPTRLGGFLFFAWLAFLGIYMMYRAARLAVPGVAERHYRWLLLLAPSLLYWPSSIGKEAWMMLGLGAGALGVARILEQRRGGYLFAAAGLAVMLPVRPHVAAIVGLAALAAITRRRWPTRPTPARRLARLGGIAVALVAAFVLLGSAQHFLGIENLSLDGIRAALTSTEGRTSQGGSEFAATPVTSLARLPQGALTVLYRPLPHEAHNVQSLVSSLEGAALLALTVFSVAHLVRLPRTAWREPYVLFAAVFVLGFVIAFSSIGNFGILARQRVQVLPFLLLLLVARVRAADPEPVQHA